MLGNYSAADGILTINGTVIDDFGESDPALTIEDVKDRTALKDGLGGNSVALDAVATPKQLTINLMPGSAQARYLVGLMKSKITIQATWNQSGTMEAEALVDGRILRRGPRARIAEQTGSLSDEQFVIKFRDSTET